jgi:hypothetical protein
MTTPESRAAAARRAAQTRARRAALGLYSEPRRGSSLVRAEAVDRGDQTLDQEIGFPSIQTFGSRAEAYSDGRGRLYKQGAPGEYESEWFFLIEKGALPPEPGERLRLDAPRSIKSRKRRSARVVEVFMHPSRRSTGIVLLAF